MDKITILSAVVFAVASCSRGTDKSLSANNSTDATASQYDSAQMVIHTEEEWRQILTSDQFYVLREKGTDAPFTGKFTYNKEKGKYYCAACGEELFTSEMKFDSHCGWPSFDREVAGGKIIQQRDTTHGMVRTEILCAKCGSHLGHIFDDGPTVTGLRYCVNSTSLDFKKEE